jgi:hypothetical protein
MADATAGAPTGLIKALQSLLKLLVSGPKEQMPVGIRFMAHGAKGPKGESIDVEKYPRTLAVKRAVDAARKEALAAIARRTVPRVRTTKILNFLNDTIGLDLDELPAPREILDELEALIMDVGGTAAAKPQGGPWSRPKGPKEWAKVFGFSPDTFKRQCKANKIRHKKLSPRKYLVHLDDVPTVRVKSVQVGTTQHKYSRSAPPSGS